eukprot:TRINITY_DN2071_c0_g1_i3.p1 TRINITY_DN2071_c0_g1~~TRINITY_DN2071_c0_g1_i3.p1  ORF type:complete len:331 (+),score=82.87 TRINITY_DN2071_c0_g1_i3:389-1381(+)
MTFSGHKGNVIAVGFESNAHWLYTASEDGSIRIWDMRQRNDPNVIQFNDSCTCAVLHPNDDLIFAGFENGLVRIISVSSGTCIYTFEPDDEGESAIRSISIDPNVKSCAIANHAGYCFVYDMADIEEEGEGEGEEKEEFDSSEAYVVGDEVIELDTENTSDHPAPGDIETFGEIDNVDIGTSIDKQSEIESGSPSEDEVTIPLSVEFNPELDEEVTSEEDVITLHWKLHTKWKAHERYILKCLYSKDGSRLATTSADHTINLWDATTFELLKTLKGHTKWVWDCVFSSDGRHLISTSSDHYARLWDLRDAITVRLYKGHQKAVSCIALHD